MEKTGSRATSHKKLKTAPITTTEQAPVKRSYPTASFQIRTALGIKELAERLADEQAIARSKLDAQIYRRGLLLTLLLCGPGADGFYAGKTEQELAQLLVPLFDRLYAVLDSHHLLANYVYRVLPPGITSLASLFAAQRDVPSHATNGQEVQTEAGQQGNSAALQLSKEAQENLDTFAGEI